MRDSAALEEGFDHFAEEIARDPHPTLRRIREEHGGVVKSDQYGGFTLVGSFDAVWNALNDSATFSTAEGTALPRMPGWLVPVDVDPPEHRIYRELLNPYFAPQIVKSHEPWIRDHVRAAAEALPVEEEFDFVERFAVPVPQYIAMRAIGIPEDDIPSVRGWAHSIILNPGRDDNPAGAALFDYLTKFLEETDRNPREDVITEIVHGNLRGRATTHEERMAMLNILLFGGLHTTTVAVAGIVTWLAQHPQGLQKLRSEGVTLRNVDEFLRYITPVSYLARTCHDPEGTTVQGCPIAHGDKVLLCTSSANRDDSQFENPDDVALDRDPNHHLAFGAGPHRCVGSHLARAELRIVLEELTARFSRMELLDESLVKYVGGEGRGIVYLPVRFSA